MCLCIERVARESDKRGMEMKKKEKSDKIEQATKKEKTNKIDTIETKNSGVEGTQTNASNRWVIFFSTTY